MADFDDKIQKYIQKIASASVTSNKKTAEWAANINKESKTKDAQLQAMTAQIQALTNTVATLSNAISAVAKQGGGSGGGGAVASAAAATTLAEVARVRSNTCITWEHTAQRMAIILLVPITPAQHAQINKNATMTPRQPTTVLVAATSGQDYARSSLPSTTI